MKFIVVPNTRRRSGRVGINLRGRGALKVDLGVNVLIEGAKGVAERTVRRVKLETADLAEAFSRAEPSIAGVASVTREDLRELGLKSGQAIEVISISGTTGVVRAAIAKMTGTFTVADIRATGVDSALDVSSVLSRLAKSGVISVAGKKDGLTAYSKS